MKKIVLLLLLISSALYAQVPQGISHRGIVYNTSGDLVTDASVKIRISILDNSITGTSVYTEIHTITTNAEGQYSLNIGKGVPSSPFTTLSFSAINWGINSKFLKIEIDPTGAGTSYPIVGTNQLMSVPYALYAQNSNVNSTAITLTTISELRNYKSFNPSTDNVTVILQGYNTPSDGGGGTFIYKRYADMPVALPPATDAKRPVHDGGVFIDSNISDLKNKGIWIRQFSGFIDIRYYGVIAISGGNDWSSQIQKAIDYASKNSIDINTKPYGYNSSNVIYFPPGGYDVSSFVIKSGVTLLGSSLQHTSIKSIGDNKPYLVTMDKGVVRDVHISNFTFVGNSNDNGDNTWPTYMNKGCFQFKGTANPNEGGGLWESSFKNISILRFTGHSMNFEGGTAASNYLLPNQFIILEGVQIESVSQLSAVPGHSTFTNPSNALRMTGQNGQFTFTNCRFDGGSYLMTVDQQPRYRPSGYNVYIAASDANASPQMINFNTCTIQVGQTGVFIDSTICINLYGCWFESFERAIVVKGQFVSSKSININGCKFLYSAGQFGGLPDNSGRIILAENAQMSVQNNYVIDPSITEQTSFIAIDNVNGTTPESLGITASGNYFEPNSVYNYNLGETTGIMQKVPISSVPYSGGSIGGLNTIGRKVVFVENGTLNDIYRINSMLNAGETIFIRANVSSITFYSLSLSTGIAGRNIYLNGRTSLTLTNGQAATFIKIDNMNGNERATYQLVSISN